MEDSLLNVAHSVDNFTELSKMGAQEKCGEFESRTAPAERNDQEKARECREPPTSRRC